MKNILTVLGAILIGSFTVPVYGAPPANDNFGAAQAISGASGNVSGTNVEATVELGEIEFGDRSVWYRWTAPSSGVVAFDTVGSNFDTLLAVAVGSALPQLDYLESDDDSGGGRTSRLVLSVQSGVTYLVRVSGYDSGSVGTIALNWTLSLPPENDNFANPTALTGESGKYDGQTLLATLENGEEFFFDDASVWFTWVAPFTGTVEFNTRGSTSDTTLLFGTGTSLFRLTTLASNDDATAPGAGVSSRVRVPVTSGTTYRIRVGTFGSGSFTLNWLKSEGFVPTTVSFSAASFNVSEAESSATITLTRTIGSEDQGASVTVRTRNGSASEADYDEVFTGVFFGVGETTATVTTRIYQDLIFEGEETVRLDLLEGSDGSIFGLAQATLLIQDDDPMIPQKAAYSGLVIPVEFDVAFTGSIHINANGKGNFTGSISLAGKKVSFKGKFDANGKATIQIPAKGKRPALTLVAIYSDNGDTIRGTLSDETRTADLSASRIPYGPKAPYFGVPKFTVRIEGDRSPTGSVLKGDSFLSIKVSKTGKVKAVGFLADGTAVSTGSSIVAGSFPNYIWPEDAIPLYVSTFKGGGCVIGVLTRFEETDIRVFKAPDLKGPNFKSGYNLLTTAVMYAYFNPEGRIIESFYETRGLGEFIARLGGLPAAGLRQFFNLNEANVVSFPLSQPFPLTLKFNRANGLFSGSFTNGSSKIPFKGAVFNDVFDDGGFGSGFFVSGSGDSALSGYVELRPAFD